MNFFYKILKRILKFLAWSFILFNLLILIIPLFSTTCKQKELNKFDVIIVLGSPATADCKPHAIMQTRVNKGVELFKKGIAKKILFTGAPVQNSCAEATVMATYAMKKGIQENDIFEETKARNTGQNAYYTAAYMKKHNYKSAAIVTSAPHIKRACMSYANFDLHYTMFPSDYPENSSKFSKMFWFMGERMILTHHMVFGFPAKY